MPSRKLANEYPVWLPENASRGIDVPSGLKSNDPPEYLYLLNPDTIAQAGAVTELVKFMEDHPRVGIAGGRAVNPDSTVRNSAFRFRLRTGDWSMPACREKVTAGACWLTGANSMCV